MSNVRRDVSPSLSTQQGLRPRSPAEALEPGLAPQRPRRAKPPRERSKKVSGFVRFLSGLMTLSLLAGVGGGAAVVGLYHLYERPGPLEAAKVFIVPAGEGRTQIAERLEQEGIISNRWAFVASYLAQRYSGNREDLQLKAGEYEIKATASMREVLEIIASGKSVGYRVVAPEGLTSLQITDRIKLDANLEGEIAAVPAEGSLAPDTYSFSKGSQRADILERMQAEQTKRLNEAWDKRQKGLPFETKEQALVLASIVEKETGSSDEREKVAAVFVNRLRKGMPLQSDPTILYGVYGGAVNWGKPILQSEKDSKNAHNTYQIKGLPPTPICNPGAASIAAVLNPATTKDLYFVADGNGGHIFTETLKDHNAAVANWRKVEKDMRAKQDAEAKEQAAAKAAAAVAPPQAQAPVQAPAQAAAPAAAPVKPQNPVKTVAAGKTDTPAKPAEPGPLKSVVQTVPAVPAAAPAAEGAAPIPNLPAEATEAAPAPAVIAPAAATAQQASTVPLPVRKPKK